MKLSMKNLKNNAEVTVTFPLLEKEIIDICEYLDVPNDLTNSVRITIPPKGYDFMKQKNCNIDELNFFSKQIKLFTNNDCQRTFNRAMGDNKSYTTVKDWIDVAMTINECGPNVKEFYECYIDATFPYNAYENSNMIVSVELYEEDGEVIHDFLYTPFEQIELDKCLKRLGCTDVSEITFDEWENHYPEKLNALIENEDLLTKNKILSYCKENTNFNDVYETIGNIIDFNNITSLDSLETLLKDFTNFKSCNDVSTPEEYALKLINSDEKIDKYVDYTSLGEQLVEKEHGMFFGTEYVGYIGDNQDVINIISQRDNTMEIKM